MNGAGQVKAELTFLSQSEGGFGTSLPLAPWSGEGYGGYMLHLVVDGSDDYLGVKFIEAAHSRCVANRLIFDLLLMYPDVDHSILSPVVSVTVREGKRIVAKGRVLERCRSQSLGLSHARVLSAGLLCAGRHVEDFAGLFQGHVEPLVTFEAVHG